MLTPLHLQYRKIRCVIVLSQDLYIFLCLLMIFQSALHDLCIFFGLVSVGLSQLLKDQAVQIYMQLHLDWKLTHDKLINTGFFLIISGPGQNLTINDLMPFSLLLCESISVQ